MRWSSSVVVNSVNRHHSVFTGIIRSIDSISHVDSGILVNSVGQLSNSLRLLVLSWCIRFIALKIEWNVVRKLHIENNFNNTGNYSFTIRALYRFFFRNCGMTILYGYYCRFPQFWNIITGEIRDEKYVYYFNALLLEFFCLEILYRLFCINIIKYSFTNIVWVLLNFESFTNGDIQLHFGCPLRVIH